MCIGFSEIYHFIGHIECELLLQQLVPISNKTRVFIRFLDIVQHPIHWQRNYSSVADIFRQFPVIYLMMMPIHNVKFKWKIVPKHQTQLKYTNTIFTRFHIVHRPQFNGKWIHVKCFLAQKNKSNNARHPRPNGTISNGILFQMLK